MRFQLFCASAAFLMAGIVACSESSTENNKAPLTGDGSAGLPSSGGTRGSGAVTGSGGTKSSGGVTGSGGGANGTGGADPADCEIDSGTDPCRLCLASHCCDDFKSCNADEACASEFEKYQVCFKGAKGDANVISDCFSTFAGVVGSTHSGILSCDVLSCTAECGGPLAL